MEDVDKERRIKARVEDLEIEQRAMEIHMAKTFSGMAQEVTAQESTHTKESIDVKSNGSAGHNGTGTKPHVRELIAAE